MKILLFARLRELYGREYIELDDGDCPGDVAALRALIAQREGGELAEALADPNVFCAVNQRVVDADHAVTSGDEIALFPPMTGG